MDLGMLVVPFMQNIPSVTLILDERLPIFKTNNAKLLYLIIVNIISEEDFVFDLALAETARLAIDGY